VLREISLTSYAESDERENLGDRPHVLSVDLTAVGRKLDARDEIWVNFPGVITL
jgi:hypothetical protein